MTVSYTGGNFIRVLLRWKGSIWRNVWQELVIFLLLFFSIRVVYTDLLPILDPDETKQLRKTFRTISHQFNDYTKQVPLTFLLGFYVSNVVSRWWRQFECLSWPEDILSVLCLVFPSSDVKPRQARHQIARYLNLTAALAWRDISSKIRRRFPTIQHLVDAGLLTETEMVRLQRVGQSAPSVRWMTPLHWAQQLISAEMGAGRCQPQFISVLNNELKSFRVSLRRLFCHDWVCVPLVYTQVAAIATYTFFFFCLFGRQYFPEDGDTDLYIPLFTLVQFMFFVGWFKVGDDLMRPFGLDDDDFELSYILDRNIVTSFSIVDMLQSEPPQFEADDYWIHSENRARDVGNTNLQWGKVDLSRTAHKHPPKLHSYMELDSGDRPNTGCFSSRSQEDKFITW